MKKHHTSDCATNSEPAYPAGECDCHMSKDDNGYWCVVCGRFLPADEYGVIVHDDIPHPPNMDFDEDDVEQ